ncbi:MAG: histidine phosphatase family protein [bacterium]|nr:histidine phosphatase family protein [bacterium]
MLLYLVRHGRSIGNLERLYQAPNTLLAPEGEVQAGQLAERLKDTDINEIWSSPYTRAHHTAEIINQYHNVTIKKVHELHETDRPSSFWNKKFDDPAMLPLQKYRWEDRLDDLTYRYQDAESFTDVVDRAKKAMAMLEQHAAEVPDDHLLLMTSHGDFLRVFLMCLLMGHDAAPAVLVKPLHHLHLSNTGLSVATYGLHHWTKTTEWTVSSINDSTHL